MSLPNNITSDTTLDKWCRAHVPGFVGVIDRTQFPSTYRKMKSGNSIIINLDPHYSVGGTHWVALRISNEAPIVYYKDSFGAPPPTDITAGIGNLQPHRGLIYGNRVYQKNNEDNCGKRSAYFLRDMANCAKTGSEIECFESTELS